MRSGVRLATRGDVPALVELMSEFYAEAGFTLLGDVAARSFIELLDSPRLGEIWWLKTPARRSGATVRPRSGQSGRIARIVDCARWSSKSVPRSIPREVSTPARASKTTDACS